MTPAEHYRAAEQLLARAEQVHDENIDIVRALARGNESTFTDLSAKVSATTAVRVALAQAHATLAGIPRQAHS